MKNKILSTNNETCDNWLDPLPVHDTSILPNFPAEALPNFGKRFVDSIAEVDQVDPGLPGSILLSVLSAVLAKKAVVNLGTHKETINLYFCAVAESGERKSPSVSKLTKPIVDHQKTLYEQHKTKLMNALTQHKIYKKRITELEKEAAKPNAENREEIIRDIMKIRYEMSKNPVPNEHVLLVDDITPEALGIIMSENNEVMPIISAEGGLFSTLAGLYNDKGCNIDLFLKSYSGEYWRTDRVTRESLSMNSPILTMGLTVQPIVLDSIKSNQIFRGRGLLSRFLYAICKPQAGYRMRQHNSIPIDIMDNYRKCILQLIKIPISDNPVELSLSKEAGLLWDNFYNETEHLMRQGCEFESIQDIGSKLSGGVARIAGLLHCADNPNISSNQIISYQTVKNAIMIGCYFRDNAKFAFGFMGKDPAIISAEKIIDFIHDNKTVSFKLREIQNIKNYFNSVDQIKPGIKLLIEKNIVIKQKFVGNTGGRPESDTYHVNPKFYLPKNHRQYRQKVLSASENPIVKN